MFHQLLKYVKQFDKVPVTTLLFSRPVPSTRRQTTSSINDNNTKHFNAFTTALWKGVTIEFHIELQKIKR